MDANLTMEDLERQTGVAARTIRYWISRGLVPRALKGGCMPVYGQQHVMHIRQVLELQRAGHSLEEIGHRQHPPPAAPTATPTAEHLVRIRLSEDAEILIRLPNNLGLERRLAQQDFAWRVMQRAPQIQAIIEAERRR